MTSLDLLAALRRGAGVFGLLVCALQSAPASAAEPFTASWESLETSQCPDWFRDAKFGIWAHWGPQSVPMYGDWYARRMYEPEAKGGAYDYHLRTYGHPSKFGYKDIIARWRAEKFDPERLMDLYQAAGARYFVSLAVHHDNFDLWNSKHQPWNAVRMGPRRDIVGAWAAAARRRGLKFGVSEHLGASFTWFQPSHGSDRTGPQAGVPYDGANPEWQALYHRPAAAGDTSWYSVDEAWAKAWSARITDLVDQYQPDLLYSDGAIPFGETGRALVAHFYNAALARQPGSLQAVYTLKDLRTKPGHGDYREGVGVQDMERGRLAEINALPWQTDTSISDWFYNQNWKNKDTGTKYRSARWVVQTLADVVSKNGNLLLNIIQRPDGALDPEVEQLLADLARWMKVNGEAIHGTRPWRIFGEGPVRSAEGPRSRVEDFAFSAQDFRFTQSKDGRAVYAIALGRPTGSELQIRALGAGAGGKIETVELLGSAASLHFKRDSDGLRATLPAIPADVLVIALKISGTGLGLARPDGAAPAR